MNIATTLSKASEKVIVDRLTNGVLDPSQPMLGPVRDGGIIEAHTAPGCWGPMITPELMGGHEVTHPVYVEGARVGDAVIIKIKKIEIASLATASGHDTLVEGHFNGDPYVAKRCPRCQTVNPATKEVGIGQDAVRCAQCGTPVTPFRIEHGYTVVFDEKKHIGITLNKEGAEKIAHDPGMYAKGPQCSIQHSILLYAPHHLAGAMARLRPFLGQLGTTPSVKIPDSHNAGDFGVFLIGAPHQLALTAEELECRTDGHMDIDIVRAGAIVVAPVKVEGAGIYMGDMHALQGDGEIAGHTMDVAGKVELQVNVLKNCPLEGPVIFPLAEDLPFLAKPFTKEEKEEAATLAEQWNMKEMEECAPISVVGTGANLNMATDNGLQRASRLLDMSVAEVRNRATINGAIEIGRHPGVIQVTFLAPLHKLEKAGFLSIVRKQYGIG